MAKNALITGASSGIGKELAHQFAKNGYDLIVVASNEKKLIDAAKDFEKHGVKVTSVTKDLARADSSQELFDELKFKGVEVHTLVNNAGVGWRGEFSSMPLEEAVEIIRLNIEALTRLTRIFLQPMMERGEGEILNVGSIAGFEPSALLGVYHASKAYVVSFTEALAEELKDTNIAVTCLCPGGTDTEFFKHADMLDTRIVQSGMLMDPAVVAEAGFKALKNGDRFHIPGAANKALTFARRVLPVSVQTKINKKFYESVGRKDESKPNVGSSERLISTLSGITVLVSTALLSKALPRKLAAASVGIALLKRGITGKCDLYEAFNVSTAGLREPSGAQLQTQSKSSESNEEQVVI